MRSRRARRIITALSFLAVALTAILAVAMVLPKLIGYERFVITSGSMDPTLPVGSIVYDRVVPVDALKVGDIITFVPPPAYGVRTHVTHRIVEIDRDTRDRFGRRQTIFRTKGDSNPDVDPWRMVLDRDEHAIVAYHLPYLGYVYLFLSRRWVQVALIGVPAILFAIGMGFLLWQTAGAGVRDARREQAM